LCINLEAKKKKKWCPQIRRLWRYYFQATEGLIWVIDSNDRERIPEARKELHGMLDEVGLPFFLR
jgi:hypothetical protein